MADLDAVLTGLTRDAAPRLAAYGFVLTGSQAEGEALLEDAIVRVLVRHRRTANVVTAERRVKAAMLTIHLARLRRASAWWANPAPRAPRAARATQLPATGEAGEPVQPAGVPPPPTGQERMAHALDGLTPHERAAVVLRHFDQLQIDEIATAMRIPEGRVEDHLAEAHTALEATLGAIAPPIDRVSIMETRHR